MLTMKGCNYKQRENGLKEEGWLIGWAVEEATGEVSKEEGREKAALCAYAEQAGQARGQAQAEQVPLPQ